MQGSWRAPGAPEPSHGFSPGSPPAPPFPLQRAAPASPRTRYVCVSNSPVSLVCQHVAPWGQGSSWGRCLLPRRPLSPPSSVPLGATVMTGLVGVFEQPKEEIKYTKPLVCGHVSQHPAELLALLLQRTLGLWHPGEQQRWSASLPSPPRGRRLSPCCPEHAHSGAWHQLLAQTKSLGKASLGFSPSNAPSRMTTNEPQTRNY